MMERGVRKQEIKNRVIIETKYENIVTKIVLWVYGGNSPTPRIMENEGLFTNLQEKHVAQVTGTMLLIQISNTNRQQFTSNNSNSTFNRAQLTGFPARTADETPKSFQSINTLPTQYRSASNILLASILVHQHAQHSHLRDLSTLLI
ncbi:hypothetical protein AVEN_216002-1 [Araneus ventricosus]|uniref:Uncharacterized protein n=1 Tax=Araneus ventricosus TaxID=182803 RepID=A0A4Y2Q3F3_ARAVE|nr:hypothetical protein AVEN_216002-1 [Araneus ventricosus]